MASVDDDCLVCIAQGCRWVWGLADRCTLLALPMLSALPDAVFKLSKHMHAWAPLWPTNSAATCKLPQFLQLLPACHLWLPERRALRRLELRHCNGVTDVGARAVANRCKELQVRGSTVFGGRLVCGSGVVRMGPGGGCQAVDNKLSPCMLCMLCAV